MRRSEARPWKVAQIALAVSLAGVALGAVAVHARPLEPDETCSGALVPALYEGSDDAAAALPRVGRMERNIAHWGAPQTNVEYMFSGPFDIDVRIDETKGGTRWPSILVEDNPRCPGGSFVIDTGDMRREIHLKPAGLSIRHELATDVYVVLDPHDHVLGAFRRSAGSRRVVGITGRSAIQTALLAIALLVLIGAISRLRDASIWFRRGGLASWRRGHLEGGWLSMGGASAAVRGSAAIAPGPVLVSGPEAAGARRFEGIGVVCELRAGTADGQGYRGAQGPAVARILAGDRDAHRDRAAAAVHGSASRSMIALSLVGGSLACGAAPSPWAAPPSAPKDRWQEELAAPQRPAVIDLAAGREHVCALITGGRVRCWGEGSMGQLGYGNGAGVGLEVSPARAGDVNVGERALRVRAGSDDTHAILEDGRLASWGPRSTIMLPDGQVVATGKEVPPSMRTASEFDARVNDLAVGDRHVCGLFDGGEVRCWGDGTFGQLGYGDKRDVAGWDWRTLAREVPVGGLVEQVVAGRGHTCALLEGGRVRCWGMGLWGQLGYGNTKSVGDQITPAQAGDVDVGGRAIELAAGANHTCALLEGGRVRCWGLSQEGRLGYGNHSRVGDKITPAQAGDVDVGGAVVHIAAGERHTCAVLEQGRLRCWGRGDEGQLGYEGTANVGDMGPPSRAGDVVVGGPVKQVALGADFTCALLEGGHVRCWGKGESGQLGRRLPAGKHTDGSPAAMEDTRVLD